MTSPWSAILLLASRQHGAVARRQAIELGVSSSTWHRRTTREGWHIPVPGVAVLPGMRSPWVDASVAALASAPGGAVTADTALAVHGARVDFPAVPVVVLPHDHHGVGRQGFDVIRSRTLVATDVVRVQGITSTTPARAMLDLAIRSGADDLRERLIDLRQRRITSLSAVLRRAEEAVGVPGRGLLIRAVHDVSATGADSVFTARVREALLRAGLHPDAHPATVDTGGRVLHPDITFAGARLAIECDSLAFHSDQRTIDLDARKRNAYLVSGWAVLSITWRRLHHDLEGFLREVRAALAR